MGLLNLVKKNKQENTRQLFITLVLSDKQVQAGLWEVNDNQLLIHEKSTPKVYTDQTDVLYKSDEALQDLGKLSEETNDVIFSLEDEWIDASNVNNNYKPLLKKLSKDLSLKPVGFVATNELYIKQTLIENPNFSGLIFLIEKNFVHLILFKNSHEFCRQKVGKSADLANDFQEAFARLKTDEILAGQHLPAKLFINSFFENETDLLELQQNILSSTIVNDPLFIQAPTVEVVTHDQLLEKIIKYSARPFIHDQTEEANEEQEEEKEKQEEIKEEKPVEQQNFSGEEKAVDESLIKQEHVKRQEKKKVEEVNNRKQYDSVVVKEDFKKSKLDKNFPKKKVKKNFKPLNPSLKLIIFGGVFLGLFVSLGFLYFYLLSNTQVIFKVKLNEKAISKESQIILDPEIDKSDTEKLILKANLIEKEFSDADSVSTTGVKLVGEKATGEVEILNKSNAPKTFNKGTKISYNDLTFILNEDVQVASASVKEADSGESEVKTYGKKKVKVTANEIGADGNLAKDITFKIENYDKNTYLATSTVAFTGGSSREIRVVAKEDRDNLYANIKEKLVTEAKKTFEDESKEGKYFIPLDQYKDVEVKFDALLGEEVDGLNLDLTIKATAISYKVEDLLPLTQAILASEIPSGYKLVEDQPQIMSSPLENTNKNNQVILKANVSSIAVPTLELDSFKQEISNKSLDEAKRYLEDKEEIKAATYFLNPSLAKIVLQKVPKNKDKVVIELLEE